MVWLGDGNSKESPDAFWPSLTPVQRRGVEAVSMDMWKAYASSTRQHVPHAEIIDDFFHLVRHVNRAVNLVWQKESAQRHLADHNPRKGTRQLWLYGMESVPENVRESFKRLWNSNLKTACVWHLKEVFRTFPANQTPEEGRLFLRQWIARALRSRLDPMRRSDPIWRASFPTAAISTTTPAQRASTVSFSLWSPRRGVSATDSDSRWTASYTSAG